MKVKLLPSLEEKKRYIAFSVISEKGLNRKEVANTIEKSCKEFLGELNYGKAGVMIVEDQLNSNNGVIRVNSKYIDHVKSSLILAKEVNGNRVIFKNNKVSGVLNKVKRGG